jgi:hypothetical protein
MIRRARAPGTWLAYLAVLGHFAQVVHFLAVPHGIGTDGHLCHVVAESRHDVESGCRLESADRDSPEEGDGEDGDGHRCHLTLPSLDPCGDPLTDRAPTPLIAVAPPTVRAQAAEPALAPLSLAPKHSPPTVLA